MLYPMSNENGNAKIANKKMYITDGAIAKPSGLKTTFCRCGCKHEYLQYMVGYGWLT